MVSVCDFGLSGLGSSSGHDYCDVLSDKTLTVALSSLVNSNNNNKN